MRFKEIITLVIIVAIFYVIFTGISKSKSTHHDNYTSEQPSGLFKMPFSELAEVKIDSSERLLNKIESWLGTPYRFGGKSRNGADCSGFVYSFFRENYNIFLGRSSRAMYSDVKPLNRKELEPGDLVFFKRKTGPIYHVGIYVRNDTFVHSSSGNQKGVIFSSLAEKYYEKNFFSGGRIIEEKG